MAALLEGGDYHADVFRPDFTQLCMLILLNSLRVGEFDAFEYTATILKCLAKSENSMHRFLIS
jgi:hypothetical protein